MFTLHPQLAKDTRTIGCFGLSRLLISLDATYPWFILVPQLEDISEIHHLPEPDRQQLLQESFVLSASIEAVFKPDKLNVAALGNQVPQLHIHHIARYKVDPAWPKPVWGAVPSTHYVESDLRQRITDIVARLQNQAGFKDALA